jgi:hypothetical protein
MALVSVFVGSQGIFRFQPGLIKQALQLLCRQRLLDVVDEVERDAFCSQDTPDLSAFRSGGLFVNRNLG